MFLSYLPGVSNARGQFTSFFFACLFSLRASFLSYQFDVKDKKLGLRGITAGNKHLKDLGATTTWRVVVRPAVVVLHELYISEFTRT